MPKTSRPIVSDIARRANVFMATVDRVLNKRPGVREITARVVLQAAAELGYIPQEEIVRSLQPRQRRIVFLLPAGGNRCLQLLGDTVKQIAADTSHLKIQCFFCRKFQPGRFVKRDT